MRKLEELKKKLKTMLLKRKTLSPDDTETIQKHPNAVGSFDYYIKNPSIKTKAVFRKVTPVIEDVEKHHFAYYGYSDGANNAVAVLETNVSLDTIVRSPDGNAKLREMLEEEYASHKRDEYYNQIGEETDPYKGHHSFYGKSDFPLGTLKLNEQGSYEITDEVSQEVLEMLATDLEKRRKSELLKSQSYVEKDFGGGMVEVNMDCWLDQREKLAYAGINMNALYYRFVPEKMLPTTDGLFAYFGNLTLGEKSSSKEEKTNTIEIINPFNYSKVIVWTKKEQLMEYFLNRKYANLTAVLGEIFAFGNIETAELGANSEKYLGGVTIDEEGICRKENVIPETVKELAKEYYEQQNQKSNIIDFGEKKEFYKRKRKEMEEKLTEKTQENIKINQVHQEQEPKKSR